MASCIAFGITGTMHSYPSGFSDANIHCLYSDDLRTCLSTICHHCNDVIMSALASQITSLTVVYSGVCSRTDQRKHQNSASLAFVRGIHRWPMNSLHKGPVTRKVFSFDDVIMMKRCRLYSHIHIYVDWYKVRIWRLHSLQMDIRHVFKLVSVTTCVIVQYQYRSR